VFLKPPESGVQIEICEFNASGPVDVGTDITHLAFEVDDLEAFAHYAATNGYPLSDGPMPTGDGNVMAFIDAPEGYEIELIQSARSPENPHHQKLSFILLSWQPILISLVPH
jgi:lactoylglutathione lyase